MSQMLQGRDFLWQQTNVNLCLSHLDELDR